MLFPFLVRNLLFKYSLTAMGSQARARKWGERLDIVGKCEAAEGAVRGRVRLLENTGYTSSESKLICEWMKWIEVWTEIWANAIKIYKKLFERGSSIFLHIYIYIFVYLLKVTVGMFYLILNADKWKSL